MFQFNLLWRMVMEERVVKRSDTSLAHHQLLAAFVGCQLVEVLCPMKQLFVHSVTQLLHLRCL